MIALVQRVTQASVTVAADADQQADYHRAIGPGLCILLGVEQGDDDACARWMAGKLARLRIFRDDQDKMNRSVQDVAGEILLISQFTLAGDCAKGNRPSFVRAAQPQLGRELYHRVAQLLVEDHDIPVATGIFGASMQVTLTNDGPVTLIVRSGAV